MRRTPTTTAKLRYNLAYIDPSSGYTITTIGSWLLGFLLAFLGICSVFFKKILRFFKKYWKLIIILLIVLTVIGFGIKMAMSTRSTFNVRIIIIGFDGLSPEIVEPMMKNGKLPNFSRLKEEGSYARLSTTIPAQSPIAWAGFATGKNPGKTGLFDFIIRDPKTYNLDLALSDIRKNHPKRIIKTKCFWQYTSDKKIPTVILSCPVTFPPDKIDGKMLSGMGVPDILGTEGTFTFYTTEPIDSSKDVGGKIFHVDGSPEMTLNLIGPRTSGVKKADNVLVPFKVNLHFKTNPQDKNEKEGILIRYQKHEIALKPGQWSDWCEVSFRLDPFRTMKGIFKFYLVEAAPRFKLYISPINFDPRDPFFQISYPSSYSRELFDAIGLYHTRGMPMDTWPLNEKRLSEKAFLEQVEMVFEERNKMLDFELGRMKEGVLFCYFEPSDTIQHMFWRYIDPKSPLYEPNAPTEYKEMIRTWYRKMDETLGRVMQGLGPNDILIVLSDHGFNSFRRAVHINAWLRKNGYLELKNPSAASGAELLQDVDWSKTRAYAIGFGSIYINQEGREKEGIVKPGAETETLKEEICRKLEAWQDEIYHCPVVHKVYKNEDIFHGSFVSGAPDLYVGFAVGYRASWQTALGAVPKELIEDNLKKWSGDHIFDPVLVPGIIFSNRKICRENPSIYDITPTVLEMVGYKNDEISGFGFDGQPLFSGR